MRLSLKLSCSFVELFLIYVTNLEAVYDSEHGHCFFDDWSLGECKLIHECPEIIRKLRLRQRPTLVSCGFDGLVQIACCSMPLPDTDEATTLDIVTTENPIDGMSQKMTLRKTEIMCEQYKKSMPKLISTQIIGGEEASLGEFPHMVALGYNTGYEIEFDCGGTLISDKYVVTAAHCVVVKGRDSPILGRVGIVNLKANIDPNDTDYYIESIIEHPKYKSYRYYHDIALIKFNRTVILTAMVYPACLNTDINDPSALMFITGWGSTSLDKISKSQFLKKGKVLSVALLECNITFTKTREFKLPNGLISGQICALDKQFLMDTCGGDSGGPLQISTPNSDIFTLIGVTSFGKACSGGIPAVYTRISSYLDWIEQYVWP